MEKQRGRTGEGGGEEKERSLQRSGERKSERRGNKIHMIFSIFA